MCTSFLWLVNSGFLAETKSQLSHAKLFSWTYLHGYILTLALIILPFLFSLYFLFVCLNIFDLNLDLKKGNGCTFFSRSFSAVRWNHNHTLLVDVIYIMKYVVLPFFGGISGGRVGHRQTHIYHRETKFLRAWSSCAASAAVARLCWIHTDHILVLFLNNNR